MQTYFQSIASVLIIIFIGYIARRIHAFEPDNAKKIIKFLFMLPLPIVVFTGFAANPLTLSNLLLPLIAILLASLMMFVSYNVARIFKFSKQRTGSLIVAAGISSTLLYVLPLVTFFYGAEGSKYLFLYDFGNGIMAWTVVYYLAGYFGNKGKVDLTKTLKSFVKTPMLWALLLGVIAGAFSLALPEFVQKLGQQLSTFTNTLLLICVGVFLDFSFWKKRQNIWHLVIAAILVMGISFGFAWLFTQILGVTGVAQKVVLMCAIAPAGSLSMAFSAEHELDLEFASALVAMTMTIGVLLIPILALM